LLYNLIFRKSNKKKYDFFNIFFCVFKFLCRFFFNLNLELQIFVSFQFCLRKRLFSDQFAFARARVSLSWSSSLSAFYVRRSWAHKVSLILKCFLLTIQITSCAECSNVSSCSLARGVCFHESKFAKKKGFINLFHFIFCVFETEMKTNILNVFKFFIVS
jgi:hypothetical protein